MMEAITVEELQKSFKVKQKQRGLRASLSSFVKADYKLVEAVKNITFQVEEGEVLAFIGPNGAGKSTAIKMLTGILYPDGGNMSVLGLSPTRDRKKLACQIGTVFGQKEQLWTHLTPYDNFMFFGKVYDLSDKEAVERIEDMAESFELGGFINTPVRNLSLGQRIRCEIAASLIHRPKILFLDEPTIGLDPVVKENIREFIKKLNKKYNTTVFLTSHDVGDIEKLCKRIIIINDGRIVMDDGMDSLKYHYLNRKQVEIRLKEEMEIAEREGIRLLRNKGLERKFEVDTEKCQVNELLNLIDGDNIMDVNISNIPLEKIIMEIYKGQQSIT
ncbi:ABC transporter ATP-binding protein [Anaerocolumna jejuensis]|uniref:ABC transporter ATP-binding protein n=1 Tax=Anaerocolumna jejuensis TaxID=259063 RepID=UPI003F7BAC94